MNLFKNCFSLIDNDPLKQGLRLSGAPFRVDSPLQTGLN